ncbi:aldo/keto reductase [Aquimarina sp. ERC-38]|uniref:aldo/keto reductase n=1 Tax=Aquimarina sp. ERC-38 TaxID=2949996 RepID=UPI0022484183|nr:aldo/keto reductase [Aquimarina sp. ERC-38]UZO81939.1 aldo/keto reductase [Aquimarina sp. ERC-38]
MDYRRLGNSDLEISKISFGCMSLDYKNPESVSLLHKALDQGVNFFDTADLYDWGENEKLIGKALKDMRKNVIIATKVGNEWNKDKSDWKWNPSKKYILQAVDRSLQRLQTDYIDLYQLHGGTIDDPIDETIEAFEHLKEQGKIRYYGISSIRPNVIREYVRKSNITSVMMQYSILDRRPEESCFSLLEEYQIGVLSRGTLAKGLLSGKPASDYLDYSASQVEKVSAKVRKIAKESNNTASQTAISFAFNQPVVASAVVGFRTREQLEDIFRDKSSFTLQKNQIECLQKSIAPIYYKNHR